jgi:hypothetical protein
MRIQSGQSDLVQLALQLTQLKSPFRGVAQPKTASSGEQASPSVVTGITTTYSAADDAARVARKAADLVTSRGIITDSLQATIKSQTDARKSIRISREKGEIWVYDPTYNNKDDPSLHAYRLQNQPKDPELYLQITQHYVDGSDSVIAQLRADLDDLDRPSVSDAEVSHLDIKA